MEKQLLSLIDARKEELFGLLSSLLRIDTQNFDTHGREAAIVPFLREEAERLGLPCDVYSPLEIDGFTELEDYLPGRNLENRPCVTLRMAGSEEGDGVHLMAHSDTVEVGDAANWERNPHSGDIENGCIYGRGACDDKYAVAASLFLLRLLHDEGITPKRPITFSAYSDEEHGGSHGAMASVIRYPHRRILNLDCKNFEIWSCAAGGGNVKLSYAFDTPKDSTLDTALVLPLILEETERFGARRKAELAANPNYEGTTIYQGAMRYMEVKCGNAGADMGSGYVWFQYYTDKTTAEMDAEIEEMIGVINQKLAPHGASVTGWERNTRSFRYGFVPKDAETVRELQMAAKRATGRDVPAVGACLSDLSVILHYGSPDAFSFGIGRDFNAPGGAHQPNEFVTCDALLEFTKILAAYLCDVAL